MTSPAPVHTGDHFESCSCDLCRRAAIAWQQLEPLRRLAMRRTGSRVDAEDAAHEAIVRALEAPDIDLEQLPAWLTRVALNLCADMARDRARQSKRIRYQVMQQAAERDVESAVVERAYSRSAYNLALTLPPAQRTAVMMRADGRSVVDVAEALEVSPKAAESLLSRARATVRRGLGAVIAIPLGLRRGARTTGPMIATAATVSSLFILAPSHGGPPATTPAIAHHPGRSVGEVFASSVDLEPAEAAPPAPGNARASRTRPARPHSSSRRVFLPPREIPVGPARVHDGGEGWTNTDQSLVESVKQCIAQGVAITTDDVGCKAGDASTP